MIRRFRIWLLRQRAEILRWRSHCWAVEASNADRLAYDLECAARKLEINR